MARTDDRRRSASDADHLVVRDSHIVGGMGLMGDFGSP